LLAAGRTSVEAGDVVKGSLDQVHGWTFKAGDYPADNELLGLQQEDLGDVVRDALSVAT